MFAIRMGEGRTSRLTVPRETVTRGKKMSLGGSGKTAAGRPWRLFSYNRERHFFTGLDALNSPCYPAAAESSRLRRSGHRTCSHAKSVVKLEKRNAKG